MRLSYLHVLVKYHLIGHGCLSIAMLKKPISTLLGKISNCNAYSIGGLERQCWGVVYRRHCFFLNYWVKMWSKYAVVGFWSLREEKKKRKKPSKAHCWTIAVFFSVWIYITVTDFTVCFFFTHLKDVVYCTRPTERGAFENQASQA